MSSRPSSIALNPKSCRGAAQFTLKVRLKDTAYFGMNYKRRLRLTQPTGTAAAVDDQVVIVGL